MKALEWSQCYIHQFFRRLMAANSLVGDGIWWKFKLIQTFMVVVTCKSEEDPSNDGGTGVVTTFNLIIPL